MDNNNDDFYSGVVSFFIVTYLIIWIFISFVAANSTCLAFVFIFVFLKIRSKKKIENEIENEIEAQRIMEKSREEFLYFISKKKNVKISFHRFLLPEEFQNGNLKKWEAAISKCYVKNGDYVDEGDIIYSLNLGVYGTTSWKSVDLKCLKSGYIELFAKIKGNSFDPITSLNMLRENDDLYEIYNTNVDKLFEKYLTECEPIITTDNFLKTKDIRWKKIAGQSDKISADLGGYEYYNDLADCLNLSRSGHKKRLLYFTLNCIENKDYIIFKTINKHLKLSNGDVIQFLFDDNSIIDFKIKKYVYNNIDYDGDKLFESNIHITTDELNKLANHTLINWKIEFKNGSDKLIDEVENKSLQFSINHFTKEYIKLVNNEIENHIPLNDRKIIKGDTVKSNKCYLYLMIDTTNNYHKIGISNSPEYREKTLQSEKPTIEMVANKEFPNRKIAHSFEQALHSTYDEKRVRGEWFDLSQEEVDDIITSLK